jgi:hypothetical protein
MPGKAFTIGSLVRTVPGLALTLIVGGVLLALGVPLAGDAITKISGNPVLKRIQNHESVSREQLEDLIRSREDALYWRESAETWSELGLAQLLLALEAEIDNQKKRDLIIASISSLKKSLARAPADAFVWTRLAYAQLLLSGPSPEVATTLRMALQTAPYEPRLFAVRLELAFLAWPYLGPDDRDLVLQQVRWAWRHRRGELVGLARSLDRIDVVRAALSREPEELLRFEKLLKKPAS